MANSIQTENILEKINEFVQVQDFILLPNKSYCFLKFNSPQDAKIAYEKLNGKPLGQNSVPLLLSYCKKIPRDVEECDELPPGLILLEDFIDEKLEESLVSILQWSNDNDTNKLKNRQVQHFGYEFLYGSNNVNPNSPLDQKIPEVCNELWTNFDKKCPEYADFRPDQLTVNRYDIGHGIPPHCDTHSCFEELILSLSLSASIVMEFKNPEKNKHCSLLLPRRSLLVMSGESRYGWTHGIVPKFSDIVRSKNGFLTIQRRKLRHSFTFRKLKIPPNCDCKFKYLCDIKITSPVISQEVDESIAAKLEVENVHNVYNEIGSHFSETRHSPWPNVENFINQLPENAVMLDVGCGNGKYLSINDKIIKLGCDRSDALLQVCRERNFQVFQCDCLQLPIYDNSIDACISIAVIHHLATRERRLKAINEMIRILRPEGLALIYVWAKDQTRDNKKTSYLLQHQKKDNDVTKAEEIATLNIDDNTVELPIHRNRTQFNHTNILVPWKLKQKEIPNDQQKTFLRYYHVFEDGELEKLCKEINHIEIIKSYYDQGNYCVILKKI